VKYEEWVAGKLSTVPPTGYSDVAADWPHLFAFLATFLTLFVPALCVFTRFNGPNGQPMPLWKIFWPAFGASNQLLAALSLAGITVWMKSNRRKWWVVGVPALFMIVVTYISLFLIIQKPLAAGHFADPVGITAAVLLILSSYILTHAARAFIKVG
jgi:carbon starvation protein